MAGALAVPIMEMMATIVTTVAIGTIAISAIIAIIGVTRGIAIIAMSRAMARAAWRGPWLETIVHL